ncbi:MAG: hypothetical protein DRH57_05190 [Candidatus Cloacimonadota bacterium]|nr:MAG: hypothetical protein DRH57_05190 [Candidatus Cloacimonadota bacterium]
MNNTKFKSIKIVVLAALFLIILSSSSFAVSEAGVIFLLIEPGSRYGAMGQSGVASTNDGMTAYWNPGAMGFIKQNKLAGMHSNWFGDVPELDDIYFEYLGYATFFEGIGTVGLNITYLTYGEQTRMGENPEDYLGTFTSYELAVAGAYGTEIINDLGIGVNFKFILSDLSPEGSGESEKRVKGRGMSFALDIGLLKKNFFIENLSAGVNIQNIGPDITYINKDQADPLPLNLRAGLSYKMSNILDFEKTHLTVNLDINKQLVNRDPLYKRWFTSIHDYPIKQEWNEMIKNFGVEFDYYDLIAIRAGYISDVDGHIKGVSFGAGVHYAFSNKYRLSFDFAFQPAGEMTDYNKTFSLGLDF